jgi:hypothetical protein
VEETEKKKLDRGTHRGAKRERKKKIKHNESK